MLTLDKGYDFLITKLKVIWACLREYLMCTLKRQMWSVICVQEKSSYEKSRKPPPFWSQGGETLLKQRWGGEGDHKFFILTKKCQHYFFWNIDKLKKISPIRLFYSWKNKSIILKFRNKSLIFTVMLKIALFLFWTFSELFEVKGGGEGGLHIFMWDRDLVWAC